MPSDPMRWTGGDAWRRSREGRDLLYGIIADGGADAFMSMTDARDPLYPYVKEYDRWHGPTAQAGWCSRGMGPRHGVVVARITGTPVIPEQIVAVARVLLDARAEALCLAVERMEARDGE